MTDQTTVRRRRPPKPSTADEPSKEHGSVNPSGPSKVEL